MHVLLSLVILLAVFVVYALITEFLNSESNHVDRIIDWITIRRRYQQQPKRVRKEEAMTGQKLKK